ncbi:hypothetical protein CDN99_02600 [Roseateles aquatilis]|uniref:DUF1043 domain-containing protein n=1 Tax=Roseateles aquatilis TaxID=431061 RepID=A0A246JMH6_9BURK|nr:hypothetical protein [Roseateles aquatilis]OWQ93389.1 hypothetical protein CDN99_02600 [Roseateles aquatilis]
MNSVQPWMVVAGALAGLAVGGVGASSWWWPRMKRARRLIDRLEAARQLLNEQTTQARRQIERMQLELGELRLIAERMRRKAAHTGSPAESLDGPDSILPAAPAAPIVRAKAAAPREDVDNEGGFARTQFQEPESGHNGFAPTQIDKPF